MTEHKPGLPSQSQTDLEAILGQLAKFQKRLNREKAARIEAETLLEQKSSELFDASEKLRIESARAQALAAAVGTASDGLALTNAEGLFTYMNPAHASMFGYTINEIMGESWSVLYKPRLIEFIGETAMPILMTEGSWRGELEGLAKSGAPVYQEVVLTLRPEGGLVCATRDIGARLQREKEARELEARLLNAEREAALFTVGNAVAHDFNNLIAAITGYGLLLQSELDPESEAHTRVSRILEAAGQASSVVRSLEVERNNDVRSLAEIDLVKLLRTGLGIAEAIRPNGIAVNVDLPDTALANCNEVLLSRALINVVKNAFDAIGTEGSLSIRLGQNPQIGVTGEKHTHIIGRSERPPLFVLEILDDGPGIPADKLERVFSPFITSKGALRGSGLGLLSLKALADTGTVTVEVETSPGQGTCFRLFFIGVPEEVDIAPEEAVVAVESDQAIRVLIVDDDEAVGQMLLETLEKLGCQPVWQSDPQRALRLFETAPRAFDVIVTDLTMPGLNGDELARAARRTRADIPLILYSGQSAYLPSDPIYADILTKPIAPSKLHSAILTAVGVHSI